MFSARDTVNRHFRVELEIVEQFRRDQKVLACALATGNIDHSLMHHALVARIHTLIDLIHDAERGAGKVLEGHEVKDRRDSTLTTGLTMRVEDGEGFAFTTGFVS
jgi:hypothetical protein